MARNWDRTAFAVHRWTGILFGLLILAVTASGALAVFQPELDAVARPEFFRVPTVAEGGASVPPPGVDEVLRRAETRHPEWRLRSMRLSTGPSTPHAVLMERPGHPRIRVFVDPNTGLVLGEMDPNTGPGQWLREFHVTLFQGAWGRFWVGIFGILVVISLLSGAWFYRRRLGQGLLLLFRPHSWRRGARGWAGDFHRAVGSWGLLLNLLLAGTGIWMALKFTGRLLPQRPAVEAAAAAPTPPPPPLPEWSTEAYLAQAPLHLPGLQPLLVMFPTPGNPELRVLGNLAPRELLQSAHSATLHRVSFNVRDGSLTEVRDRRAESVGSRLDRWSYILHIGDFAGLPGKILYLLMGLAPTLLAISGVVIWLERIRKGRAAPPSTREGGVAVPAPPPAPRDAAPSGAPASGADPIPDRASEPARPPLPAGSPLSLSRPAP